MYAIVQPLYREGRAHRQPEMAGQLESERDERGAVRLVLWPLDFVASARDNYKPQAVLWQPTFIAITQMRTLVLGGLEAVQKEEERCWFAQRWMCEIRTSELLRSWGAPDPRIGKIK